MLENIINPLITENYLLDEDGVHFLQNAAPPHYILTVR